MIVQTIAEMPDGLSTLSERKCCMCVLIRRACGNLKFLLKLNIQASHCGCGYFSRTTITFVQL